jgi:hypothetical protein
MTMTPLSTLPATGLVRLSQIIGNPKANPPIPPIIPVSKSTWWKGCKEGKFPAPVHLTARTTAWRVTDILMLIETLGNGGATCQN